jgi:hypothetical protein
VIAAAEIRQALERGIRTTIYSGEDIQPGRTASAGIDGTSDIIAEHLRHPFPHLTVHPESR